MSSRGLFGIRPSGFLDGLTGRPTASIFIEMPLTNFELSFAQTNKNVIAYKEVVRDNKQTTARHPVDFSTSSAFKVE